MPMSQVKIREVITLFYSALVKVQMNFSVQFCASHFKQDVEKLKRIERQATKIINAS